MINKTSSTLGHLCDLLCAEPDLYEYGEVLCHRLPTEVEVSLYSVPGKEGGGRSLVTGCCAGPSKELDTGILSKQRTYKIHRNFSLLKYRT